MHQQKCLNHNSTLQGDDERSLRNSFFFFFFFFFSPSKLVFKIKKKKKTYESDFLRNRPSRKIRFRNAHLSNDTINKVIRLIRN